MFIFSQLDVRACYYNIKFSPLSQMPRERLELSYLAVRAPKARVSTNFTIWAEGADIRQYCLDIPYLNPKS